LEGTLFVCASGFLVCARLTACVRSHDLEGTLMMIYSFIERHVDTPQQLHVKQKTKLWMYRKGWAKSRTMDH